MEDEAYMDIVHLGDAQAAGDPTLSPAAVAVVSPDPTRRPAPSAPSAPVPSTASHLRNLSSAALIGIRRRAAFRRVYFR